jgi:hypothetical protein
VTLRNKQADFAQAVARLIQRANHLGYTVTLGEAERTQEQADLNAAAGSGISNSLHCSRLAIDLNIYDADGYVQGPAAFNRTLPLGEWWEAQGELNRWGGRFSNRMDCYHFSYAHDGCA